MLLVLNIIFCLAFAAFAYFNLNGADPWLWIPVYMSASICCAVAIFEMYYPTVYILLMLFYLIYAAYLFFAKDGIRHSLTNHTPGQKVQSAKPSINQTRNFIGLFIITGALVINYLAAYNIL